MRATPSARSPEPHLQPQARGLVSGHEEIPYGVAQVRRISWVRGVGPAVPGQETSPPAVRPVFFIPECATRNKKTALKGRFK